MTEFKEMRVLMDEEELIIKLAPHVYKMWMEDRKTQKALSKAGIIPLGDYRKLELELDFDSLEILTLEKEKE